MMYPVKTCPFASVYVYGYKPGVLYVAVNVTVKTSFALACAAQMMSDPLGAHAFGNPSLFVVETIASVGLPESSASVASTVVLPVAVAVIVQVSVAGAFGATATACGVHAKLAIPVFAAYVAVIPASASALAAAIVARLRKRRMCSLLLFVDVVC